MQGYEPVFQRGEAAFQAFVSQHPPEELFESFHCHNDIYGFIHCCDMPPEESSIALARTINDSLYQKYMERNAQKKLLGLKGYSMKNATYNLLDSRHIMMSVALFSNMPEAPQTILEIGGGFGNWLRLNSGVQEFQKWYVVDMPYVSKLQEWYLTNSDIPRASYQVVPSDTYKETLRSIQTLDLVIGAHSVSELSWDIFNDYFTNVILKAKYFFYAYHKFSPDKNLIDKKLNTINIFFEPIYTVDTESGNVANTLFKRKV